MLTLTTPDYDSQEWGLLSNQIRTEVRGWLNAFQNRPERGITKWLEAVGASMGASYATARRNYDALKLTRGDWTVLVDKRLKTSDAVLTDGTGSLAFRAELVKTVEKFKRNNAAAFRALKDRWLKREAAIPGYEDYPGWPKIPLGWGNRNLGRIVKAETNRARQKSIRIGTSSKTNDALPTVLTTRVGLWPGAVIQLDDMWHDNKVTYGKDRKPCRIIEMGACDLFSADRFHWGAKPRRKRADGTYETLSGADMRMFLAGMFHRFGYSPRGTMLMSEHQTAKVPEEIARMLYDATGGLIRVDYQPIEGKQAALCGFWAGSEGGNFHAKACLESTHNLIHNDLSALPMQTGSPSSGLKGPVTTDRINAYILRVLADVLKKCPHRADLLRLPTLDFHTQFIPFVTDYYEFGLNGRTDHNLEGWATLNHVINEYTTLPGSDQFFSEAILLGLPAPSQIAIREAARMDPMAWSRRRNLSPAEVFNARGQWRPIPPVVLCDMLGGDLAREVTARRGFLEFSDAEISAEPLIYQSRYCAGPRRGTEIGHGEKISMLVLPFDNGSALVVDAKGTYLGEVPLYRRVLPIDPTAFKTDQPFESRPPIRSQALTRAAGEKHSRWADILEPTRINHREEVQEAQDMRAHNKRVLSGAPITPEELHLAAVASGQKGARTAAANRLDAFGSAVDYDTAAEPQRTAIDPYAGLSDDDDFPDSI